MVFSCNRVQTSLLLCLFRCTLITKIMFQRIFAHLCMGHCQNVTMTLKSRIADDAYYYWCCKTGKQTCEFHFSLLAAWRAGRARARGAASARRRGEPRPPRRRRPPAPLAALQPKLIRLLERITCIGCFTRAAFQKRVMMLMPFYNDV